MIKQSNPPENQDGPTSSDRPIHIDAILLDLFMPDLEAFTLVSRLRASPDYQKIPILVITEANLSTEQHQQLTEFGKQLLTGSLKEKDLLTYLGTSLTGFGPIKTTVPVPPASNPV